MNPKIEELKRFLIDTLNLENISPREIDQDTPLFGQGLGLDSIDALELGIALKKKYGIKIDASTKEIGRHFATLAALAAFIEAAGNRSASD